MVAPAHSMRRSVRYRTVIAYAFSFTTPKYLMTRSANQVECIDSEKRDQVYLIAIFGQIKVAPNFRGATFAKFSIFYPK